MKHIPIPILTEKQITRFWSRVQKKNPSDCWDWIGWLDADGYGQISFQYKTLRANRIAYLLATGEEPGKLKVCHTCDNPKCCNSRHLWLGTARDNNQDCSRKGHYVNQKGIQNPRAKLTEHKVLEIRKQFVQGIKQCELVRQHNISCVTIHNIVRRKTWKHI